MLPAGLWTKNVQRQVLETVTRQRGGAAALRLWGDLIELGFELARRSGVSISPFVGEGLSLPPSPNLDDPGLWDLYFAQINERLHRRSRDDAFDDSDLGLPLLAVACGARGLYRLLPRMIAASPSQVDTGGRTVAIRHGLREGLSFDETTAAAAAMRQNLRRTMNEYPAADGPRLPLATTGDGVPPRALRSCHPGVVFADAAHHGDFDPLSDLDSRVFAGKPPAALV